MVLKVLDGAAGGPTAGVLDAIAYARDNGAKIVNLSLTSLPADDRLYRAVRDSEMLFVVSAGNQHTNLDTALPRLASYSLNNLVSVANRSRMAPLRPIPTTVPPVWTWPPPAHRFSALRPAAPMMS